MLAAASPVSSSNANDNLINSAASIEITAANNVCTLAARSGDFMPYLQAPKEKIRVSPWQCVALTNIRDVVSDGESFDAMKDQVISCIKF